MNKQEIIATQTALREAGFYAGKVDGIWGALSQKAQEAALDAIKLQRNSCMAQDVPPNFKKIAWGAKVSPVFKARVCWIAEQLKMPEQGADWLMSCMAFESGESFSPSVQNAAGSGAVGLIQFMPKTARDLGTTTQALSKMSAEEQLNYVYKYFLPFKGRLHNLSDVYMAILWPLAAGKPDSYVLWDKDSKPTTYRQNAGLDINKDFVITKGEAARKVSEKLQKGLGVAG